MSLVATKCPNCGASIMLDAGSKEGFCTYCGSKLKVQDVINRVKIDKTGDAANYLALAEAACEGVNADEAYGYANKAIEVDAGNVQAWYLKLRALGLFALTEQENRAKEAIACGDKVIELDPSMKKEVYRLWLTQAEYSFCSVGDQSASSVSKKDDDDNVVVNITVNLRGNKEGSDNLLSELMMLRNSVPTEEILKDDTLTGLVLKLAKMLDQYQLCQHQLDGSLWESERTKYEHCLAEILEGLPDEVKGEYASFTPYLEPSKSHVAQNRATQEEAPWWAGCLALILIVGLICLLMKACVAVL